MCRAFGNPAGCPLYDFAVLYGAPDERPGHGAANSPPAFLHFELLGGRDIADAAEVHSFSGTRPLQRLIGTRTIAGHRGRLFFGLPYNRGGGELGSHFTFIWRQGRWGYAASLHSWTPHSDTLAVLAAIIEHITARRAPTAPADAPLRLALPGGWDERETSGGIGADPTGIVEVIAANFHLPPAVEACEGGTPRLGRADAIVRIYDYGVGAPTPSARPVRTLRLGRIVSRRARGPGPPAFSFTRFRYRGHLIAAEASFGTRHPPHLVLAAARRVLAGARPSQRTGPGRPSPVR